MKDRDPNEKITCNGIISAINSQIRRVSTEMDRLQAFVETDVNQNRRLMDPSSELRHFPRFNLNRRWRFS